MQKEFSRRDFLKGMAVVTASGLLVACGGGNGTPVKLAFVAMDNFYDQDETLNGYVLCQGFQVKICLHRISRWMGFWILRPTTRKSVKLVSRKRSGHWLAPPKRLQPKHLQVQ